MLWWYKWPLWCHLAMRLLLTTTVLKCTIVVIYITTTLTKLFMTDDSITDSWESASGWGEQLVCWEDVAYAAFNNGNDCRFYSRKFKKSPDGPILLIFLCIVFACSTQTYLVLDIKVAYTIGACLSLNFTNAILQGTCGRWQILLAVYTI